ncbi:MAG: long-chain fatty acid transporter [Bacteroidetes bacterium QH_7_62_13]|nr:MAG: long-chain fatty acid transporter [Bacteroidetes bacterium QH_7_62_13]
MRPFFTTPLDSLSLLAVVVPLALLASLFGTPTPGQAQGFGVYEQGTCVMSTGGATVASSCGDGSSIYFNPANLVGGEGTTVSLGATVIDARGSFTYDSPVYPQREVDLENDPIPAPHLYAAHAVNDRVAVGLGTYAPYGLQTVWPVRLENGDFFDGAFEGYNNSVQAIYVQPTAAYQLTDRLAVGGGPIVAISSVELNQVVDLASVEPDDDALPEGTTLGELGVPHHTAFATSTLEGSGAVGYGANFGVSYQVTNRVRVGLRGTTPITINYDGEVAFEQVNQEGLQELVFVPPSPLAQDVDGDGSADPTPAQALVAGEFQGDGNLVTQDVETELTFPAQIVTGASIQATDRLQVLVDYQYTRWSSFEEIPLDFEKDALDRTREENYDDTHALRIGGAYDVTDQFTARVGYLHNTPAAPDEVVTPLLPEAARNQLTVGLGWKPIELLEINASYQLLLQNDRRGRVRSGDSLTTDLNNGLYQFGANLFGTTLTLHL